MNILLRKLIFNEADIHLILWNDKPCFFVSELSKALDSVNKDDIPVFLRNGGSAVKGVDYDVVGGAEARDLRNCLANSGIKKKFAHTMILYFDGLRKYFNYRRTIESKDFINYLEKCKISLEADETAPIAESEPATEKKQIAAFITESEPKTEKKQAAASAAKNRTKPGKKQDITHRSTGIPAPENSGYSEFLKHIYLMEEFVDTFNRLSIPADKAVAFTKSMAKFLEDSGIKTNDFLNELKKWIE